MSLLRHARERRSAGSVPWGTWRHLTRKSLGGQVVVAMYTCRDEAQRKQINAFMTAFQVCEHADVD